MNVLGLAKNVVIGRAKNFSDQKLFHRASLIAMFAWVGLGADPVSSSGYGPESVFLALGAHTGLSLFVAAAVILTIVVICASYSQIIEHFPAGGGGYLVASNGLPFLRKPRVRTGKRTMIYMGASLALLVGGLLLAYLLYHVTPVEGKTLNAVLFGQMTSAWPAPAAKMFMFAALASAALLLFIAAETGFLDGPRVLANMAADRWMPTRFASLSDRLVTQNGILLMGLATLIVLLLCRAAVDTLIILYSINVFVTFSLSQLGMVRHWWLNRGREPAWKRKLLINGFGLLMTGGILISLCIFKFFAGGWVTLLVTGVLIAAAFGIKRHYRRTQTQLQRLDELVAAADMNRTGIMDSGAPACHPDARTAVFLVNGFNGLGLHTLLAIIRMFPRVYQNYVFLQVGVVDAGSFKGAAEVENLRDHSRRELERYAAYMRQRGFYAEAHFAVGTDVAEEAAQLCEKVAQRLSQAQFFAGQLVFKDENLLTRWLHNYTVFELQRRLYQNGRPLFILPIQV